MKRPIIGITTSLDDGGLIRDGIPYAYVRRDYAAAISAAGGVPVMLDPSADPMDIAGLCDGIVISGGADIDPKLYGAEPYDSQLNETSERTVWERKLIDACDEAGTPILGICYGQQLLNVHYGGTLYQDIEREYGSDMVHGSSDGQAQHHVIFSTDFLGFKRGEKAWVASRHHQAIRDLAPGFKVVARSIDGVIESIEGHGHFGVQWHAEADKTAANIYGHFLDHCEQLANMSTSDTSQYV